MDALFVPLASAVGASVDQIKVISARSPTMCELTIPCIAHIMSTNSIPPRERLYSHTIISAQSKAFVQFARLRVFFHTRAEPAVGAGPVVREYSWNILHCG
jgi:hypothetical protein